MISGNVDRFAIEFDVDLNESSVWMVGHTCYWLCGQRIGDWEQSTSLRDVLFCWTRIACDTNRRSPADLMTLDKEQLANLLWQAMYGNPSANQIIENRALEEQWARFVVVPEVDVFDGTWVFLLENAKSARCVVWNMVENEYYECQLNIGEFDRVLQEAIQAIEPIYAARSQ